jgi:hypothetical protein
MKYLTTVFAILFICGLGWCQAPITVQGQKLLRAPQLMTFSSAAGTYSGKTRFRIMGGFTYVDTSATGQTGAWRRIENTADSASDAVFISGDSAGTTRPVWMQKWVCKLKSADADTSGFVLRGQAREFDRIVNKVYSFTQWSQKGSLNGTLDAGVQDSALFLNVRGLAANTNSRPQAQFWMDGTMARFIPRAAPSSPTGANDSVICDSCKLYMR